MSPDDKRDEQTRVKSSAGGRVPGSADSAPTAVRRNVGRLTVVAGPGTGRSVPIQFTSSYIGRDESNEIPLNFGDDTIHRKKHALMTFSDDKFRLIDMAGKNPLSVNGKVVEGECEVQAGDHIVIGSTTLRLERA